jgi:hypothetical protein
MLRFLFAVSLLANLVLAVTLVRAPEEAPESPSERTDVVLVHFSSTIALEPHIMTEMACTSYEDPDEGMFDPCNQGTATLFAQYGDERVQLRDYSCRIREVFTNGGARYVPMTCDDGIDPWTTTYDIEGLLYPGSTLEIRTITPAVAD